MAQSARWMMSADGIGRSLHNVSTHWLAYGRISIGTEPTSMGSILDYVNPTFIPEHLGGIGVFTNLGCERLLRPARPAIQLSC